MATVIARGTPPAAHGVVPQPAASSVEAITWGADKGGTPSSWRDVAQNGGQNPMSNMMKYWPSTRYVHQFGSP